MEGGVPVKPMEGKVGRPEESETEGMTASLLSESEAAALSTLARARWTDELLRCASCTTVASVTCADAAVDTVCQRRRKQQAKESETRIVEFCHQFGFRQNLASRAGL